MMNSANYLQNIQPTDEQLNLKAKQQYTSTKGPATVNYLRASHKFKKAMKLNWDRIFPKQTYVGNPIAHAFNFRCLVKHSETYEVLKSAHENE